MEAVPLRQGTVVTEWRPCTAECPVRCSLSPVSAQPEPSATLPSLQESGRSLVLTMSQGTEIRRSGPESAGELGRLGLL